MSYLGLYAPMTIRLKKLLNPEIHRKFNIKRGSQSHDPPSPVGLLLIVDHFFYILLVDGVSLLILGNSRKSIHLVAIKMIWYHFLEFCRRIYVLTLRKNCHWYFLISGGLNLESVSFDYITNIFLLVWFGRWKCFRSCVALVLFIVM